MIAFVGAPLAAPFPENHGNTTEGRVKQCPYANNAMEPGAMNHAHTKNEFKIT